MVPMLHFFLTGVVILLHFGAEVVKGQDSHTSQRIVIVGFLLLLPPTSTALRYDHDVDLLNEEVLSPQLRPIDRRNPATPVNNPLGRPNSTLPIIERDDETVPEIPSDHGIYDFIDHGVPPPTTSIGFPPGCLSSNPLSRTELVAKEQQKQETQLTVDKPVSAPAGPKCNPFNSIVPALGDWVNGNTGGWTVTNEGLVGRLAYSGPQKQKMNILLVSRPFLCEESRFRAAIRLDYASEAGIAFRIAPLDTTEFLVALISSGDSVSGVSKVSLVKVSNGNTIRELAMKPTGESGTSLSTKLEVIDHGKQNVIEVKVNGRTMLTKSLKADKLPKVYGNYRAGIFIGSGNADFSKIQFSSI